MTCDDVGMRRPLLLVRHATSAWDDPSLAEPARPLAPRGRKAVRRLHEDLEQAAPAPEIVLCSSSRRTIESLDGFRSAIPPHTRVEIDETIYEAHADTLLRGLQRLDDEIRCAMMIGHNPGMQDLTVRLAGSGDPVMLAQVATKFPTAAVATLSFEGDWSELIDGSARIDDLFMPRRPRP